MAKLSQPPDSSQATPVADLTSDAITSSGSVMPSPALRPLPLEASLQSHGNDSLPSSPPCEGSGRSSLSPADCRTLKKILCDVSNSSPSPTASSLNPAGQLSPVTVRATSTVGDCAEKHIGCHVVGDKAADIGYEDEDGSMELSDGVEGIVAADTEKSLGDPASPSVSKSDRRLQESVSMHDEKDRLRCGSRSSSFAKNPKPKRHRQEHNDRVESAQDDTVEGAMNFPRKLAPSARPLDLGCRDPDRQSPPDDIKHLNWMRLSAKKLLEDEPVEQEIVEGEHEPSGFIQRFDAVQDKATGFEDSDLEGSDADQEEAASDIRAPQRKKTSAILLSQTSEDATLLVPSTPTVAAQTPDRTHIQVTTNQHVPETPFTKTLSYFKQYNGTENTPPKRRRNTALPSDIADLAKIAVGSDGSGGVSEPITSRPVGPDALAGLDDMVLLEASKDMSRAPSLVGEGEVPPQMSASTTEEPVSDGEANDSQKQLILYPQHPAFVNVIGMIPSTMFWATAAPIVKYTNIAVDMLIEKLRDTYL